VDEKDAGYAKRTRPRDVAGGCRERRECDGCRADRDQADIGAEDSERVRKERPQAVARRLEGSTFSDRRGGSREIFENADAHDGGTDGKQRRHDEEIMEPFVRHCVEGIREQMCAPDAAHRERSLNE
jgi:hypothetical protein